MTTQIDSDYLEIYIKYRRLQATDLIELIKRINELYNDVQSIVNSRSLSETIRSEEFLEIQSINTGESIRIRFTVGINSKGLLNLHVPVPNKTIILHIILALLGNIHDSNELEIEKCKLKTAEVELKIKENDLTRISNVLNEKKDFRKNTAQFIEFVNSNNNFISIEINECKTK